MTFFRSISGTVQMKLVCADPEQMMLRLTEGGIAMYHVKFTDPLTVEFFCSASQKQDAVRICQKRGASVEITREQGPHQRVKAAFHRPVLMAGLLFFLILTLWLPTRVLFIRVEGNTDIPAHHIIRQAEICGIRFGASRREVRSEKMKNALLAAIPKLKWAGINTSGCTAVITVREQQPEREETVSGVVSSIAATRDGYITSCTVTAGTPLCKPGQIVRAGQLLVSGYTDCGICIRVTPAEGEIFAQTSRDQTAVYPLNTVLRQGQREVRRQISLIIGKKRINFLKDSGIWDTSCGRMYEEYYITLPGGFRLPLGIGVQTVTLWNTVRDRFVPGDITDRMVRFACSQVLSDTVAGQILQQKHNLSEEGERILLFSRFLCSEMIGRVITEEIGEANGKTD